MELQLINLPLLEFDPERALVEPRHTQPAVDVSPVAVACFFPEIISAMTEGAQTARPIMDLPSRVPLWEIDYAGERLALFFPGIGAPLAAYSLERVIAAGCRTVVACGGSGALRADLKMGDRIFAIASAIRDEGTSYHYIPASRSVAADARIVDTLVEVAKERGHRVDTTTTWTTDGFFRETPTKIKRRSLEGCQTVEMEASALIAVSMFHGIRFGQYLYAGDDLSGHSWDSRHWWQATELRHLLVDLSAEAALRIARAPLQPEHG